MIPATVSTGSWHETNAPTSVLFNLSFVDGNTTLSDAHLKLGPVPRAECWMIEKRERFKQSGEESLLE